MEPTTHETETKTVLGIAFWRDHDIAGLTDCRERWTTTVGGVDVGLLLYTYGSWMAVARRSTVSSAKVSVYAHGDTPEEALRGLSGALVEAANDVETISTTLSAATGEL